MNKIVCLFLTIPMLSFSFTDYGYIGSTTAAVTLVGSVIKAQHIDKDKKYPRKDCPVCKGTGKYLSGDGIKMVDCGYCELNPKQPPSLISHPPATIKPGCKTKVSRSK